MEYTDVGKQEVRAPGGVGSSRREEGKLAAEFCSDMHVWGAGDQSWAPRRWNCHGRAETPFVKGAMWGERVHPRSRRSSCGEAEEREDLGTFFRTCCFSGVSEIA